MASVAICPHCYLQLVVPDGVEPDERVECPTCAKEFALDQAVLRPIPEVVRRSHATPVPVVHEAGSKIVQEALVEEVDEIEIEESILKLPPDAEREADDETAQDEAARYIDELKARIESDIAATGLVPGSSKFLSLDSPDAAEELDRPAVADDPLAMFRNANTMAELPSLEDELDKAEQISIDLEVDEIIEEIDEPAAPIEPRAAQPTVRTLADLMPPREETSEEPYEAEVDEAEVDEIVEEVEAALGPSFDLPNVPLVPNNGATVEIDPNMLFGPAAETEFELDDVDFEALPAEEQMNEEEAEEGEPVFSEPQTSELPAAPFVLPGIPRARKKRSIVRTLVGTAVGALVGLSLGYFILLYALGPEGDVLQVAKYIPKTILPKSFDNTAAPLVPVQDATSAPGDIAANDETADDVTTEELAPTDDSANIPAGYTEESPTATELTTTEPEGGERYGTEPAPLEEPAAEPIAEETPAAATPPLPLRGPSFTVDQLATALEAGKAAQPGLVTGDLSDAAVRRTKGASYEKLGALAEALTFVDRSAPSIESEDATSGSEQLFGEILADTPIRNEISRIVSIWIDSTHRKNSGIFLAGITRGGQIAGDVYEYTLATDDGAQYTLLAQQPLEAMSEHSSAEGSDRPVGIIGVIVENPAATVTGYQGMVERAIWVTRALPLD